MVGAYQRARRSPEAVGLGVLSLFQIERPTEDQYVGAFAIGDFLARANHFLSGGK